MLERLRSTGHRRWRPLYACRYRRTSLENDPDTLQFNPLKCCSSYRSNRQICAKVPFCPLSPRMPLDPLHLSDSRQCLVCLIYRQTIDIGLRRIFGFTKPHGTSVAHISIQLTLLLCLGPSRTLIRSCSFWHCFKCFKAIIIIIVTIISILIIVILFYARNASKIQHTHTQ